MRIIINKNPRKCIKWYGFHARSKRGTMNLSKEQISMFLSLLLYLTKNNVSTE